MGAVVLAMSAASAAIAAPPIAEAAVAPAAATPPALAAFFAEWRRFAVPPVTRGAADYGAAAMAAQAAALPGWRRRLAALDRTGWPVAAQNDWRLVEAELNGLDFDLRVLRPWARDPSFYANVFADRSDVPAHEGSAATPNIDLYDFTYPLKAADDRRLTALLAAIPANLSAARVNLKDGNARDLWLYGDRAFKEQSATLAKLGAGTLVMRTLDGPRPATLTGASPALRRAIAAARAATDEFAVWVAAEARTKTGPSGVGKTDYNWFVKHVLLLPYDWEQQVTLLQRELDHSLASLRLEELRNRKLPPIAAIDDPAGYNALVTAKAARFSDFVAETGLAEETAWARAAIAAQGIDYTPPAERNFFAHVVALDPLPLISHFSHWIDLARLRAVPSPSPVRRVPPLFNIYADRSEGFATAFEEVVMHAGLYDDVPHGRELVWIMLANRAARGLASLRVQANEIDLAEAGKFHASWTPRGWSDPASPLVGFEQLLYLRQPGYGPSYIVGKLQLDRLIADASHDADVAGKPFDLAALLRRVMASAILPVGLIEGEVRDPAPR